MGEWFAGSAGICWAQALQALAVSGVCEGWGGGVLDEGSAGCVLRGNSSSGGQSSWSRVKDVLWALDATQVGPVRQRLQPVVRGGVPAPLQWGGYSW